MDMFQKRALAELAESARKPTSYEDVLPRTISRRSLEVVLGGKLEEQFTVYTPEDLGITEIHEQFPLFDAGELDLMFLLLVDLPYHPGQLILVNTEGYNYIRYAWWVE